MKFWKLAATATVLITSTSVNAALIERLGGLAYYDDVADLTWLASASAPGDELFTWAGANNWAANLTVNGVGGWRLPDTLQPDASCELQSGGLSHGFNCTGSEMGNLFYNVLGNSAGSLGSSTGSLTNTGPFSNVQTWSYWSATDDPLSTDSAWAFSMFIGYQHTNLSTFEAHNYAWAVQSGDVGAVPVPAAVWLFGSGLVGLVGLARRKR